MESTKKPRIISGITATGKLTIGNYIGAIRNFIKLQDENELLIFVANLHAITMPIDKSELRHNIKSMVALYYACGLNETQSTIFIQSDVLEHANLAHILLCNTTLGELNRMTQFKDKSTKAKASNGSEFIPTGLLTYPTLMAADILLYDADLVPVGKDQKQHIELTRNIAERMNNKYNPDLFKVPTEYIPPMGAKIMDLQDPSKKMSKSSDNEKSFILMLDTPEAIMRKIKSAVTDSENKIYLDWDQKPGISNLLTIYCSLKEVSYEQATLEFANADYGVFKTAVAQAIIDVLTPIQTKYHELFNSPELDRLIEQGANRARAIASKKLTKVLNNVGLNYKRK